METHGFLINDIPVLMGSGGLDTAVEVYIDKRNISLTNAVAESLSGWERIPFDFDGFDVPNPRINRLYWPTGASKFSHVHFLVLDADYAQIKSQADQSNGKVTVSEPGSELSTEMYMLPAVPIFEIGLQKETLWLLTLVDERWHWWSLPNSIRVRRDISTTWDGIYDAISTLLDEVITVEQAIEAAFLKPSDLLTSQNQPLPILFDSVNFSLGRELIRRLNGDLVVQTFEAGWLAQEALISGEGGSSVGNLDGLRAGSVIEYKQRSVPETGDVSFPYQTRNRPRPGLSYHSIVTTTLPDGVDVFIDSDDISGSHRLKSTAVAVKLTDDADESTAPTSPDNAAALNTLAGDWWFLLKFRWFARIDVALNGIELVTLNTLMDHVEWCVETGNVETRIHPYMPQQYVDGWHDAGLAYAKSRIESTYQPLNWRNEHITGAYYRKDDVAFDGTFIGIANKDTTDAPALASPDWDVLTTAPFGGNITVEEEDGTPSYTDINIVQVDQDQGLSLSQPAANTALITNLDASITQTGVVNTTTQTFGGIKTFRDIVNIVDSGVNFLSALQLNAASGADASLLVDASASPNYVSLSNSCANASGYFSSMDMINTTADGVVFDFIATNLSGTSNPPTIRMTGMSLGTPFSVDGVTGTFTNADITITGGIVTAAASGSGGGGVDSIDGETGAITFAEANDTNVTLVISAAAGVITFTMGWTGTLASARGGTGFSTYTKGDILWASATNVLSKLPIGSSAQVLTVDGSGNVTWATPSSGVTDHGALTGLGDDDHVQYVRVNGRASGQIIIGGISSGNSLQLNSTSDATKGGIRLGMGDWFTVPEITAPGTPTTGTVNLYAKTDGLFYSKDDAGTETLVSGGSAPAAASLAEMEAASSTTTYVSPGRQSRHPRHTKAWVNFTGSGTVTINADEGVSSVSDGGTGNYTVSWDTSFSSASYAVSANAGVSAFLCWFRTAPFAVGSVHIGSGSHTASIDADRCCVIAWGDQ